MSSLYAAGVSGLLEGMAMGRLVVSRTEGLADYLTDPATHRAVAAGSAAALAGTIQALWDDAPAQRAMAGAARTYVETQMSMERYVKSITAIVRRAAEEGELSETPKPRILFLAHLLPYPLDGGAKIKSYYTLRKLAEQYEVTLLAFVRSEDEKKHVVPLRDLCAGGIETVIIHRSKIKNVVDAARMLPGRKPFIVGPRPRRRHGKAVRARLGGRRFDAVHIDHLQMAQYVLPRKTPAKLVLDHHNVESQIIERMAETTPSKGMRRYADKKRRSGGYVLETCRAVDRVFVVSNEDKALTLHRLAPDLKNLSVVPIGVDGEYYQPAPRYEDPKTLLSIGTMYWPPNVESILWFYSTVYAMVKAQVPDVKLSVVGAEPDEKICGWRARTSRSPCPAMWTTCGPRCPTARPSSSPFASGAGCGSRY